jgi:hypothetical protein
MFTHTRRRQYLGRIICRGTLAQITDPFFQKALYNLAAGQVRGEMRYASPLVQDCELAQITEIPASWPALSATYDYATVGGSGVRQIQDVTGMHYLTGLRKIGAEAFRRDYNPRLTAGFYLPESIEDIGQYAFAGNLSMTGRIDNIQNAATLSAYAFQNCQNLYGIIRFHESVEEIPDFLFAGIGAAEVVWPEDANKRGITELHFHDGIRKIGRNAFQDTKIKGSLDLKNIEEIGDMAFISASFTGSLLLPDTVKLCESNAFANMYGMTGGLTLSANPAFVVLEQALFSGTPLTGTLYIPPNITEIKRDAFKGNHFSGALTVPATVTVLQGAFTGSALATSLVVQCAVETVPVYLIANSPNITSVSFQPGVTSVDIYAFSNCPKLETVSNMGGVTWVNSYAFQACAALSSIDLSSVASVGEYAFLNARIPDPESLNLTGSLGKSAFKGCKIPGKMDLSRVTSLANFTYVVSQQDGLFYGSTVEEIDFGDSTIETLPPRTFFNCGSLHTLSLPPGLKNLGDFSLTGCSALRLLNMPASLQHAGMDNYSNPTFYANTFVLNLSNLQPIYASKVILILNDLDGDRIMHVSITGSCAGYSIEAVNISNASAFVVPVIPADEFAQLLTVFDVPPIGKNSYKINTFSRQTYLDYVDAYPGQEGLIAAKALGWSFTDNGYNNW